MTKTTKASQAITVRLVIHLEDGRSLHETLELPDDISPNEEIEFHVWTEEVNLQRV